MAGGGCILSVRSRSVSDRVSVSSVFSSGFDLFFCAFSDSSTGGTVRITGRESRS